jgi:diguanylate cyclase (GGDEF)-like protein
MINARTHDFLSRLRSVATLPAAAPLWALVLASVAILALAVAFTAVYLPLALKVAALEAAYHNKVESISTAPPTSQSTLAKAFSIAAQTVSFAEQRTELIVWGLVAAATLACIVLLAIATLVEYRNRQKRDADAYVHFLVHHDALTGLPNRILLNDRLRRTLARPRNEGVAVLCLDLDRFKDLNDTLGHPVGDALLKAVAERLRNCVRDEDTVARWGGDEFVVVQRALKPSKDAAVLASRIISKLSEPFTVEGHRVVVGCSIGIAVSPTDGIDPDILLKYADVALYRSKSDAPGTFSFFQEEMNTRIQARRTLEHDLRRAITNGEFELFYQPLLNLRRNEVSGFEALLRWRHPERGLVLPGTFIPLAEETGLILPIGEWVIGQACREATNWPHSFDIAVNLSAVQFKNDALVGVVRDALACSGLSPERLELEITESVLLKNNDAIMSILRELRTLGVRVALDDFGTGYSSLSYLRSFPFDKIKIDRQFIADLSDTCADSLAIVRAVARLGGALGMSTTAEGVETRGQLERVRAEGCTEMQGYLLSPPQPASEIARLFLAPGAQHATAA